MKRQLSYLYICIVDFNADKLEWDKKKSSNSQFLIKGFALCSQLYNL